MSANSGVNGAIKKFSTHKWALMGANGAIKKFSRSTMSTSDAKDEIKKIFALNNEC